MQIVSYGDNLHEMSKPISGKTKENISNLSSVEFAHSMVSVKPTQIWNEMLLNGKRNKDLYEGVSINNQPIPFPMDRDGHDFHALFQYILIHGYKIACV